MKQPQKCKNDIKGELPKTVTEKYQILKQINPQIQNLAKTFDLVIQL
jgi:hypothetical protein